MAANQGLNLRLSADASQFIATLQAALAQAQAAASGMASAGASMNALVNAANAAAAAAAALAGSLNSTTQAGNNAGSSTRNLASTLNFVQQGATRLNISIQNFNKSLLGTSPVMRAFVNDARNGQLSFIGLNGAVSSAGNAITGLNRIIQSVNNSMVALNRNLLGNSPVMRAFANQARLGQISYVGLNGAVTNAGRAVPGVTNSLNRLGNSTNRTGQIAMNAGRIFSDLPFGFIAIQNNITPLLESLGLHAGLGLAFTIAGAAATALVQRYGSLSNAFDALFGGINAAEKAQKALNKAQMEASGNAAAELVHLKTLYDATQNLNVPLAQRNKIIDKLQKDYPAYFGNLSNEAILTGKATKAYGELRNSIIAVAQAKAIEEQLVEQSKALDKIKAEYKDINRDAQKYENKAFDIRAEIQRLQGVIQDNPGSIAGGKAVAEIAHLQRKLIDVQAIIDGYNQKLIANRNRQQENADISKELADRTQDLASKFDEVTTGFDPKTPTKKLKTVAEILKELNNDLTNVDAQAKSTNASFDSISNDKVAALQKAFKELIDIGLKPTSPEIQKIVNQIELFSAATIGSMPIATKNVQALGKALQEIKTPNLTISGLQDLLNVKDRSSQLNLSPTIKISPVLLEKPMLDNMDKFQKQFNDRLDKLRNNIQSKIDKTKLTWGNITSGLGAVSINLGAQLQGVAAAAAVGIGEVIGGIISGGDSLGKSLYQLVAVMGQFIIDFGKSLIEAATLRLIAEKTLFANPYVALAAGIAAVAAGSILKNKTPSFATGGGIIGGPQLAMIGDNPGREEYVIPSEVLDRLGGGGPRIVRVVGVLRGQDIAFANQRATRAKSRIN